MPPVIHVIVCVLGAFAGGAALGWLVGLLKARTGAHEVIVTIMLNYVMVYLLSYLLSKPSLLEKPGANGNLISPNIASNAHLPLLPGTHLRINAGFLLALACAAGVWWLMSRSTLGFEFRTVGANPNAARSAGMSVPGRGPGHADRRRPGGLAASTVIQGTDFSLNFQSSARTGSTRSPWPCSGVPGRAAWSWPRCCLARCTRAPADQASTGVRVDIVQIIEALIVMFVAAPPLIRVISGCAPPGPAAPARSCPKDGTLDDARRHGTHPAQRQPPVRRAGTFLVLGLVDILVFGRYAHPGDATLPSPSRSPR